MNERDISNKSTLETTVSDNTLLGTIEKGNVIGGNIIYKVEGNTIIIDGEVQWYSADENIQNEKTSGNYASVKISANKKYTKEALLNNATVKIDNKEVVKWDKVIDETLDEDTFFVFYPRFDSKIWSYTVVIEWENQNTQTFIIQLAETATLGTRKKGETSGENLKHEGNNQSQSSSNANSQEKPRSTGNTIANGGKVEGNGANLASKEETHVNTLVTKIKSLYANEETRNANGLVKDNINDKNIRYAGSNANVMNYVKFGNTNEIWRIIGIFKVKTSSGVEEELVKLVKDESIGDFAWDNSPENDGDGINQWGESGNYEGAYLMRYLNGKSGLDSFSINKTLSNMIETVVWNTCALNAYDTEMVDETNMVINTVKWYNNERRTEGNACTNEIGENNDTDTVTRTSTWTGKIALPYASDWAYASSTKENDIYVCHTNMWEGLTSDSDFKNGKCKQNNWMHTQSEMSETTWMLSPLAGADNAYLVSVVCGIGGVSVDIANHSAAVRPTIYLKSNIQIDKGTGSSVNPYILKLV